VRVHYAQLGSDERLIVLLHGFPECWYSWRLQLVALAQHATVIAPDMRGYNETEKPAWGYTVDVLAQDVAELIRALGRRRAVLVGHDWGGAAAWALALAYPQRVERLAVLNMPHPALLERAIGRNWRQMLRMWYVGLFQLPWLPELMLRHDHFRAIERIIRGTSIDTTYMTDEDMRFFRQAAARPGALRAMLAPYRAMLRSHTMLTGRASWQVQAPTLLIWGEQDIALGKELTYGTERYVPDLRMRYVANCGHFVHQEQPWLVNRLLVDFLQEGRR
jgi:pimeloyl-ACP methyl ester carboxylesterase